MAERLGAQNLLRRVDLAIPDVAAVARREYHHGPVAQYLDEVVVEIPRVIHRVGHEQHRRIPLLAIRRFLPGVAQGHAGKQRRHRRACEAAKGHDASPAGEL